MGANFADAVYSRAEVVELHTRTAPRLAPRPFYILQPLVLLISPKHLFWAASTDLTSSASANTARMATFV
jgi:hypothetical protein